MTTDLITVPTRHCVTLLWLSAVFLFAADAASAQQFNLFPKRHIYPHYVADPLRTTNNLQFMVYDSTTIANTGIERVDIKFGGSMLLGEWRDTDRGTAQYQLVLDAGFHGQFDNESSQDNIGWDGIYGLGLFYRHDENLAYRIGTKHISAHIGDELIERTGRTRINYTREEYRVGVSWSANPRTDTYFDVGYAFNLRNKILQEAGRAQLGLQYMAPHAWWSEQLGWYYAMDISAFEENNWDRNITLQVGLHSTQQERVWRLGFELYDGRAQLGEFFQDKERYISLGMWMDL